MFAENIERESSCLTILFILASLGFVAGLAKWGGTGAGYRNISTVMVARYYASRPNQPEGLPRLPRAVFLSLLFFVVEGIGGRCPVLPARALWLTISVTALISAGAWLMAGMVLQSAADEQRKKYITEFIDSAPGSEPQHRPHIERVPLLVESVGDYQSSGLFFYRRNNTILAFPRAQHLARAYPPALITVQNPPEPNFAANTPPCRFERFWVPGDAKLARKPPADLCSWSTTGLETAADPLLNKKARLAPCLRVI